MCSDCREAWRVYQASWVARNKQKTRETKRAWYARNREQADKASAEWKARHPEYYNEWKRAGGQRKRREAERRREAMLRGATAAARFTPEQLEQRMSMFPGCWVCGGLKEQVDHVKPVSKGGPHILANLRPICSDCNLRKSAKWPFDPAA